MRKLIFLISISCCFLFSTEVMANVVKPEQTYTYEQMKKDIWELNKKYRDELTVKTIGYSHFGRRIMAVKLGDGQKNVLFIGSHHGREWLTSLLLMEMLETYTKAYAKKEKVGSYSTHVLDEVSIWFVPMLNPDGVTIQQGKLKEFPKYHRDNLIAMNLNSTDFTRWKANGLGIDLNRQYPSGWDQIENKEINAPNYQFYKGKKPLATHETKAIVRFTKKIKPVIAISYHTSGREIFWNYHNGENKQRDLSIAQKVAALTEYELSTPPNHAVGAGYTDWFISTFHRPALTIEVSPLIEESNPPITDFTEEWRRNKLVGMMLIKEAKNINKPK